MKHRQKEHHITSTYLVGGGNKNNEEALQATRHVQHNSTSIMIHSKNICILNLNVYMLRISCICSSVISVLWPKLLNHIYYEIFVHLDILYIKYLHHSMVNAGHFNVRCKYLMLLLSFQF